MAFLRFNVCHLSKAPDTEGVRAERWVIVKNEARVKPMQIGPEYLTKAEADAEAARLREQHA
jgi:hypothetical protein